MGSSKNVEKFLLLLILNNFVANLCFECVDSGIGSEIDLDIMFFSGIDGNNIVRNYLDKLFLQLFKLVFDIKSYFYLLL